MNSTRLIHGVNCIIETCSRERAGSFIIIPIVSCYCCCLSWSQPRRGEIFPGQASSLSIALRLTLRQKCPNFVPVRISRWTAAGLTTLLTLLLREMIGCYNSYDYYWQSVHLVIKTRGLKSSCHISPCQADQGVTLAWSSANIALQHQYKVKQKKASTDRDSLLCIIPTLCGSDSPILINDLPFILENLIWQQMIQCEYL